MLCNFVVLFFFNRWVLTVLCLLTMFDFGEFVHLDTSVLRYMYPIHQMMFFF